MESAKAFCELFWGAASFNSDYWRSFIVCDVQLGLHLDSKEAQTTEGITPCFRVENIGKFRTILSKNNVKFAQKNHETPCGSLVDFYDPEGHYLPAIEFK